MSRCIRSILSLKIKNYEPFLEIDYHLIGLPFPSSRMYKDNFKFNTINNDKNQKKIYIDKSFSQIEREIGLDFPSSRFN
jgi:hypothetical protein